MNGRRLDPVALVFGVIFALAGGFLLSGQFDELFKRPWAWPLALIAVAVILFTWLAADLARRSSGGRRG